MAEKPPTATAPEPPHTLHPVAHLAPQVNRRSFLAGTGVGMAGMLAAGAVVMGCGDTTPYVDAATTPENNVFNFALNLEYLEATFYSYIVTGQDLNGSLTGGGPAPQNPPPQITFPSQLVADLFAEILYDEMSHVQDLQSVLNSLAIQRPLINFAALGAVSSTNYLPIARLFEDVGVTAYAGAAATLIGPNITAAAQILAVEGFHAGALRLLAIQTNTPYPTTPGYAPPDGYDIIPADPGTVALAMAGPTQAKGGFFGTLAVGTTGQNNTFNGFAFTRTTSQVLSILYGSTTTGTAKGGFFPNGVNGAIVAV